MNQTGPSKKRSRLVIFSPFYFPELISTGRVNTQLGNEVVRQGWAVDVVCSHPLYPEWRPARTDASLPETVFYRGGGSLRYSAHPLLRRIALELWFAFHCAVNIPSAAKEASVALMVYPPSLFGLVVHAMLPSHVRRVALVHDLQGEYSQRGYHSGFSFLTRLIHAVESRCLRSADRCIFFSQEIAQNAQRAFGIEGDHLCVQYPFVTVDPDGPISEELGPILPLGVQHVVYAGALGEKQNPRLLADLMETAARAFPGAQFHIFSNGPNFNELRKKAGSGSAVQFHDLVTEAQLTELYARSAIQIIPQAPGSEGGSLPSKLPNLLAMGVHVMGVCSEKSEVAHMLQRTGTGTIVSEWTADAFVNGVRDALLAASAVSVDTRRRLAAPLLERCRVSSLAQLILS